MSLINISDALNLMLEALGENNLSILEAIDQDIKDAANRGRSDVVITPESLAQKYQRKLPTKVILNIGIVNSLVTRGFIVMAQHEDNNNTKPITKLNISWVLK